MRALMSLEDAADEASVSISTIRRAVRKTKRDGEFPNPLPAKKVSGKYRVRDVALQQWIDDLPDA